MKKLLIISVVLSLSISCSADKTKQEKTEISKKDEGINLFDGKTLNGWKTVDPLNAHYWSVIDGKITASNGDKKMPINTYLATTSEYEDFEFTCDFRLIGDPKSGGIINSGIQYRSFIINKKRKVSKNPKKSKSPQETREFIPTIVGYQADIGEGWWGGIYDEHRRRKLVKGNAKALLASEGFKHDNWHSYRIVCKGDHHQLYINGFLTAEYTEIKKDIPSKGIISLQLHKGGVAKIEYKNIKLKQL